MKIQKIIDRVEGNPSTVNSYEHLLEELQVALQEYREKVDEIDMNPSDKKKILSLPFFLAKRQQLPEPRRGQNEIDLFTALAG